MNHWDNLHILVTRPSHQAQGLIALLSNKGASVLLFPTLVIQPVSDMDELKANIQQFHNADWYMFISPNAVDHVLPILKTQGWLPRMKGQFATVGAGTRDALAMYGVNNIIYPLNGVGANALLDALSHEEFTNKQVAIFKGDSHNQTLEEGLAARGAIICPIPCYQRHHTQDDPMPLVKALGNGHINVIVTTSGDGLQSLVNLLPASLHSQVNQLPVVVVSPRVKELAHSLGFSTILLAKDASDQAIVSAIEYWQDQGVSHD